MAITVVPDNSCADTSCDDTSCADISCADISCTRIEFTSTVNSECLERCFVLDVEVSVKTDPRAVMAVACTSQVPPTAST